MRRRNQGNTLEILLGNRALSHPESLFTSKFFISGKSGNILPGGRELRLSEKQINTSLFRQSTGSLFHPGKNLIYFSSFSTVYFQEETPAEEGFNVKPITESLTFVVKWVKKVRLRVLGKADGAAQRSQTAPKTFKHTPPSPAGLLQLPAATLVISQGGEEEEEYSLSSQLFLEEREVGVGWGGGGGGSFTTCAYQSRQVLSDAGENGSLLARLSDLDVPGGSSQSGALLGCRGREGVPAGTWGRSLAPGPTAGLLAGGPRPFFSYFLSLCVSNIACRNLQGFVDTSCLTRRTRSTV